MSTEDTQHDSTSRIPPVEEQHPAYSSLRRKKIFTGISLGVVFALIVALAAFVDADRRGTPIETLPANSLIGWWSAFCPAHNTIAADADALNTRENEETEAYLDRLAPALERAATDFRSYALALKSSAVMAEGSEKQKEALTKLIDVINDGDALFSDYAAKVKKEPITRQEQMDKMISDIKAFFERYSQAVQSAIQAVGMGDAKTRHRIESLSECRQLVSPEATQGVSGPRATPSATTTSSDATAHDEIAAPSETN